MSSNESGDGEPFMTGARCVRCGEPVLDIPAAVIHRRLLYHAPCWLQMMSGVSRVDGVIAGQPHNVRERIEAAASIVVTAGER
jgi:hypothetical protein